MIPDISQEMNPLNQTTSVYESEYVKNAIDMEEDNLNLTVTKSVSMVSDIKHF